MLPLYEAKMIHHFDSPARHLRRRRPKRRPTWAPCHDSRREQDDPSFVVMPRYWVQEFDTLNEQKSKPGKPVYDHGVSPGWKPSTGSTTGSSAGATSAAAPTSGP